MSGREELRAAAEVATPGPWFVLGEVQGVGTGVLRTDTSGTRPALDGVAISETPTDAAYIAAADPPTVLALLDALDAAEDRLALARHHIGLCDRYEQTAEATLAAIDAAVSDASTEVGPESTEDANGAQNGGNG